MDEEEWTTADPQPTIFDQISESGTLMPVARAEDCFPWLERNQLTWSAQSFRVPDPTEVATRAPGELIQLGVPCQRVVRKTGADLKTLKAQYKKALRSNNGLSSPEVQQRIWEDYSHRRDRVMLLDVTLMPADAIAFYRPFHLTPNADWGIYLYISELLNYCHYLLGQFKRKLTIFDEQSLVELVLCEVFHHEFFHHLVESAATTIEIVFGQSGLSWPVYREYRRGFYRAKIGPHAHDPLEEALANAYAFNSLGFISYVNLGCKSARVRVYQEVLKQCWPRMPRGYCFAGNYTHSAHVTGAAQLLAMLLNDGPLAPEVLRLLATAVCPMGHTAFAHKADVPTYLVGSTEDVERFLKLVPAPNETYTGLFSPRQTSDLDEYLRKQVKARKDEKAGKATVPGGHSMQPSLFP